MLEHGARFSLTLNDLSMDLIDMSIALYAMSYQITSMFNQVPLTTQYQELNYKMIKLTSQ